MESKRKASSSSGSQKQEKEFKVGKGTFIQYKKGLIEKDYKIAEVIGSGAFASVRKVFHKSSGQPRALKIIKKQKNKENARMYLEVEILKKLVHPNIMQIFEFYEDKKNFYIITELCEGGELFDKIVEKGSFSESEAAWVMKQLLSAVNYIHSNHIVHRDLKPENILLDTKKDNIIKIIDWGTARFFDKSKKMNRIPGTARFFDKSKKMNRISGTPYYIAPEVLAEKYDEKCDIWSCGIILYILLCGYPPFNADSDEQILEKIKLGHFSYPAEEWDSVSPLAKDLVNNMLQFHPSKRLSASEALEHKWLLANNNKTVDKKILIKCLNNMKKFHAERKLQQVSLTYIVNNLLSKEEKNDLLELFQQFDLNGDGVLSKQEILNAYKQLMPFDDAEKEVERIMNEVDIDKNGTIDYNEFVLATINKQKLLNKEKLEATFRMFDKDGSGTISADEIKSVLGKAVDKKLLEEMVKEVDENGDGEISLVEFKEMMLKFLE